MKISKNVQRTLCNFCTNVCRIKNHWKTCGFRILLLPPARPSLERRTMLYLKDDGIFFRDSLRNLREKKSRVCAAAAAAAAAWLAVAIPPRCCRFFAKCGGRKRQDEKNQKCIKMGIRGLFPSFYYIALIDANWSFPFLGEWLQARIE